MMTDQEVVEAVLLGDSEQYSLLVSRYQVAVRRLCLGYMRDEMLADDMAQEAFVRAYKKLSSFDQARSFKNWILTIAANISKDALRSRARQEKLKENFKKVFFISSGEEKENKDLVRSCLKAISQEDREILILREYMQLDYNEISEILGVTKDAVKGRLKRARKSFDVEAISRTS